MRLLKTKSLSSLAICLLCLAISSCTNKIAQKTVITTSSSTAVGITTTIGTFNQGNPPPYVPNPMEPGSDGPWNHRVLLAGSSDGMNWHVTDELQLEKASVPELFIGPDGNPFLFYVDASGQMLSPGLGAMVKRTNGTWVKTTTNLFGADPNVIRLKDGSYRAYTKEKYGEIIVFSSTDGLQWQKLGIAFYSSLYPEATDPDVFETKSGYIMLLSLGPRLLHCTSSDGLTFTAGNILELGGSVSDTIAVNGGWRTFFHVNSNPQSGGKMVINSAFTTDGIYWNVEKGNRLSSPNTGPAQRGVADPAPVSLPDGNFLMAIKSFIN